MKKKITSLVSMAMSAGMLLPLLSTTTVAASLNDGEGGSASDLNRAAYYSFSEEIAQDAATDGSNQSQPLKMYNELWNENYQLNEKYLTDMEKYTDYNHPRHYLGQPDMVRTRTGKLITAYPVGHGVGALVMRTSTDNGKTWVEKGNIPEAWKNSQETPTLYALTLPDGRERIMLITACPTTWGKEQGGWETSYSDDDGETWTPYKSWHSVKSSGEKRQAIVAMASLVQMRDPQTGEFLPKWTGIYHDDSNGQFVNYKTYLTFENEGGEWVEKWSEPTELLPNYHEIETQKGMCEIGMFRSPDGKRIVALARNQKHNGHSTMTYSDDEGETWSQPVDLPGSLAGERHKAIYDPISGRLLIAFRRVNYDLNQNGVLDDENDWRCGGWEAWVGTYEDLMAQKPGDFTFVLDMDYAPSRYGGDTGYTGITVLEDGTFVMNSYGHFDEQISKSSAKNNINVYGDICYIRQARFKLGEIENDFGRIDRAKIEGVIQEAEGLLAKEGEYTADSFAAFKNELEAARAAVLDHSSQQIQLDQRAAALETAIAGLIKADLSTDAGDGGHQDVFIPTNAERTEGKWVRYNEEGVMVKGEDFRYGGWYWFDPITGEMTKGFVFIPEEGTEGKWVYYDEIDGQMHHGESCIDGNWYYFDEWTGKMVHGEYYRNNHWYYYDQITGIMAHGWVTLPNGEQAYYDEITGVRR